MPSTGILGKYKKITKTETPWERIWAVKESGNEGSSKKIPESQFVSVSRINTSYKTSICTAGCGPTSRKVIGFLYIYVRTV